MSLGERFPEILSWLGEMRDTLKTTWKTASGCGVIKKELIALIVYLKFEAWFY